MKPLVSIASTHSLVPDSRSTVNHLPLRSYPKGRVAMHSGQYSTPVWLPFPRMYMYKQTMPPPPNCLPRSSPLRLFLPFRHFLTCCKTDCGFSASFSAVVHCGRKGMGWGGGGGRLGERKWGTLLLLLLLLLSWCLPAPKDIQNNHKLGWILHSGPLAETTAVYHSEESSPRRHIKSKNEWNNSVDSPPVTADWFEEGGASPEN